MIHIHKRSGASEPFQVEKIKKMIQMACDNVEGCDPLELELDSRIQFHEGMTTVEIQKILIQTAIGKLLAVNNSQNSVELIISKLNWQYVAAKLLLFHIYKEAKRNRGYEHFGYGNYYELIDLLTKKGMYGSYLIENYSKAEIEELGSYINQERDYLFNYEGAKLLIDRYLIKGYQNEILELPQERFMTIAMHLAIPEEEQKVAYAKKFYDAMSSLKMTVATPTLGNAGTPNYQLSSCFISTSGDNLWSIYDVNDKFAQVSKNGGGMGIYVGKIRALGSEIQGIKNRSGGVIPWIRLYNDTAVAVDQLGKRKGGASITLDIWHQDLYDFLDLRTNNGDDRRKAHDIFPALSIPDLFMERLEKRQMWCLFDPHNIYQTMGYYLEDYYDDEQNKEFSKRYLECEKNPCIWRIEVMALDVMKKIMKSAVETGTPFIFFRDTVNRLNPNKHAGMIYASNLCHEIAQNTSESVLVNQKVVNEDGNSMIQMITKPGDMVVCNLNSINLSKVDKEELAQLIPLQIRMLDNVVTLNKLPVMDAEVTCEKYRAIGLGTSGYHQYLVNHSIRFESEEHLHEADELFEEIAYQAINASMELAKQKGAYPYFEGSEWENGLYFKRRGYTSKRWLELQNNIKKYGIRNGYIMAVAPTGTTSNIANTTAGIDPIFKRIFVEEKKGSFTPKVAPDLSIKNYWYYQESHTIDQMWSIRACAVRQRHIDQAQSFNLYITPQTSAKEILNYYIEAWKQGIKTIYYIRNQSLTTDECVSCSS